MTTMLVRSHAKRMTDIYNVQKNWLGHSAPMLFGTARKEPYVASCMAADLNWLDNLAHQGQQQRLYNNLVNSPACVALFAKNGKVVYCYDTGSAATKTTTTRLSHIQGVDCWWCHVLGVQKKPAIKSALGRATFTLSLDLKGDGLTRQQPSMPTWE